MIFNCLEEKSKVLNFINSKNIKPLTKYSIITDKCVENKYFSLYLNYQNGHNLYVQY